MEEVLGGSVGGVRAMLIGRVATPISASPLPFSTILKAVEKVSEYQDFDQQPASPEQCHSIMASTNPYKLQRLQ